MIYTHAAAALVAAAIAAAGAWQVQSWRYGTQLAKLHEAQAVAVQQATEQARATEQANTTKTLKALNERTEKTRALQAIVAGNRTELERLRDAANSACSAGDPTTPGAVANHPAGTILAECAAQLVGVAQAADGHAADAKTLFEAWPTTQPAK